MQATQTDPVIQIKLQDDDASLLAYINVDTLINGKAMGGVRMAANATSSEVAELARKMSLKLALADIPVGGCKGGIVGSLPDGEKRRRLLRRFGQLVSPLLHGGIYLGIDMGLSFEDRAVIMEAASYEVREQGYGSTLPCTWAELWQECSDIGGHGVGVATCVIADRMDVPARQRTVAIHGFGTMGRGTAIKLVNEGFHITSVADLHGTIANPDGIPLELLLQAVDSTGTIDRARLPGQIWTSDDPDACLNADAEFLILAATQDTVREDNVAKIRAKYLIEAANFPCTEGALAALHGAGVSVVPDIAANCGSASASGLVIAGLVPRRETAKETARWLFDEVGRRISTNIAATLELAAESNSSLPQAARTLARQRLSARGQAG